MVDGFCQFHVGMRDSGKNVPLASWPEKVLVKANINPKWRLRFLALGIPEKHPDFAKKEAEHVADAERHGRSPYAICKNVADSGVPIFGPEGLKNVSVGDLLIQEASRRGYYAVDIHIFSRSAKGNSVMSTLVITLATEGTKLRVPTDVKVMLTSSTWGHVHVWVNPPKPGRGVLHTVNLTNRSEDPAEQALLFADGLWAPEPYVDELPYIQGVAIIEE
jgi:hypothetical protein